MEDPNRHSLLRPYMADIEDDLLVFFVGSANGRGKLVL
jgi:hypothetical protein